MDCFSHADTWRFGGKEMQYLQDILFDSIRARNRGKRYNGHPFPPSAASQGSGLTTVSSSTAISPISLANA